jgi:hypothetical protein
MSVRAIIAAAGVLVLATACSEQRGASSNVAKTTLGDPPHPSPGGLRTIFDGIRVDVHAGIVEFDARVSPMLVSDPRTPTIYLETVVCAPDTREHETLLVSPVRPSSLHAAMLMAGLTPGEPGRWRIEQCVPAATPPSGDRLRVEFVLPGAGGGGPVRPESWIVSAKTGGRLSETAGGWVFAGSRLIDARTRGRGGSLEEPAMIYDADGAGVIVGLASFGNEVIAWSEVISPESRVQPPEWAADLSAAAPAGTPVVVRVRRAE